jgi:hypothetical protein
MMFLRVYWALQGDHAHLRVFLSHDQINWAFAGNLVMRSTEFILLTQSKFAAEYFPEEDAHDRAD